LSEVFYLTVEDVVEIHNEIMERMRCPFSPLLHRDKLDSAIHRPRQLIHYEPGADLFAQAVSLAVGISQAQAFQDGNKRAAFEATDTFLAMNGISVDGDPVTFACWLICVAGNINNDDIDVVAEHLGLELAAELDVMKRELVCRRFEEWLRNNASDLDPTEFAGGEP
jgi:death-on-curing protein